MKEMSFQDNSEKSQKRFSPSSRPSPAPLFESKISTQETIDEMAAKKKMEERQEEDIKIKKAGCANPDYAVVEHDPQALSESIWSIALKEVASIEKTKGLSIDEVYGELEEYQSRETRYLGLGVRWLSKRELQIAGNQRLSEKAGGLRDGQFVLLVPAGKPVLGQTVSKIDCFCLARVHGHPEHEQRRVERMNSAVLEAPSLFFSADYMALETLSQLFYRLRVECYITRDSQSGLFRSGQTPPGFPAQAWMAINPPADILGKLLCISPSKGGLRIGRLSTGDVEPLNRYSPKWGEAPRPEVMLQPLKLLRTRSLFLGVSGSGKSNALKNLILTLKGPLNPLPKKGKLGILMFDPQGEYSGNNIQDGVGIAGILNSELPQIDGLPPVALYSVREREGRIPLRVNFHAEPKTARELIKAKIPEHFTAAYSKAFLSANIPSPKELLQTFMRESLPERLHTLSDSLISTYFSSRPNSPRTSLEAMKTVGINVDGDIQERCLELDGGLAGACLADHLFNTHAKQINQHAKKRLYGGWFKLLLWWMSLRQAGFDSDTWCASHPLWKTFFKTIEVNLMSVNGARGFSDTNFPPSSYPDEWDEWLDALILKKADLANHMSPLAVQEISKEAEHVFRFCFPSENMSGPLNIVSSKPFHAGGTCEAEAAIVKHVVSGGMAIVDLSRGTGELTPEVKRFFTKSLCDSLFRALSEKFFDVPEEGEAPPEDNVLVIAEEAHEILDKNHEASDSFREMALMGRKCGIGVIMATQSPSNLHPEMVRQASNAFVMKLTSPDELTFLARQNVAFEDTEGRVSEWTRQGLCHWFRADHAAITFQCDEFPSTYLLPKTQGFPKDLKNAEL